MAGKAHRSGGAIIHATPPALRHRYAEQIARTKAQRRAAAQRQLKIFE